jgi:catechol 2,3-dioxygenase-like lactoylglutathione lyase family enzyme
VGHDPWIASVIGVPHKLVALDHVQLAMPAGGEMEAERFYQDLLGLLRVPKPPALAARGGCWFTNGTVQIHLGVDPDFVPARKAHPALLVEDLDALVAVLEAGRRDVRFDDELPDVRRCYVNDPFGNRIELIEAPSD